MAKAHIYNTGIIGNCSYITHVDTSGNIVWMCWPRFDSSFIFGGLLDKEKGGEFSILPEEITATKQYYIENTNILCTEITSPEGRYRITDYAPRFKLYERFFKPLMLFRKIEALEGKPRVKVSCHPVTNYGAKKLKAFPASNHIDFSGTEVPIRLTTNCSINHVLEEEPFVLNETKYLVLSYGSPLEAPLKSTAEDFLHQTKLYWQQWIKNTSIEKMYQDEVIRSSLVLKIHQYEDTGAIIASSTTSLPESPGSSRTWDYRYCWLRDAYYILQAFNNIGHFEEMEDYFNFIANVSVSEHGRYQPMYGITGRKELTEKLLPLAGYMGNKPVRIGNQASEHIQNDVYGQVLISLLPLYTDDRFVIKERTDSAQWITSLLEKIEMVIDEKDAGLWEFRNAAYHHCYTSLFHWAGCHAAIKIARRIGNKQLMTRAQKLMKKAARKIEACYNPEKKVYQHAEHSPFLDASTLQLIMMGYLDPASARAKNHLKAVEAALSGPNGLFFRYKHSDDFGLPKSTFLITAFWHVEALACVGRLNEAIEKFEELLSYGNHLGLLSEDVDPSDGSQWGNYPQGYSHVGLMNAAYRIAKKLDRPNFL
jgi:GH15 family glucan-1,4-alpha-glucosidase